MTIFTYQIQCWRHDHVVKACETTDETAAFKIAQGWINQYRGDCYVEYLRKSSDGLVEGRRTYTTWGNNGFTKPEWLDLSSREGEAL